MAGDLPRGDLPPTVAASRSVEKALEEAAASGQLSLSNRRLKEFPRTARNYDLSDITHADLSKNRLCELPEEVCSFVAMETLSLYHNCARSLSPSLPRLQNLTHLNLSRNLLSLLPSSVCELSQLRVLIVSNNKLSSLPASIHQLTQLRQLDASCNELQSLPVELGQLDCLRDLNLRRNQLTSLPEELADLPLVRLDVSCNRVVLVPVCFRRLRSLQTLSLEHNPLLLPPARVCARGRSHVFKHLNLEACRRSQEERTVRPTAFNSCLSDQEYGQYGGLDSGFNSVDSGSKRWSGNESADEFSGSSSLRVSDVRDQRNLEEEEEEELDTHSVLREEEQVDFIDSSVTEEEEEEEEQGVTAPPAPTEPPTPTEPPQEKKETSSSQTQDSIRRSSLTVEMGAESLSPPRPPSPRSPSSPPEERRRPGTLIIWQERERAQREQQRRESLLKTAAKTGSQTASASQTGSSAGDGSENTHAHNGLRQRCASAEQMSSVSHAPSIQRSTSRADVPSSPKPSSPPGLVNKPNSFLFRTSSRCNVKSSGSVQSLVETGRSESRSTLRSPREERPDVVQLRKTLESRLKTILPEDLGEALSNGTVLCQLANHVRPRAVSTIHVPSPAVPKLSTAKCRLNVENFIMACRKLGVPEVSLCSSQSVLEEEGLTRVALTVHALLELRPPSGPRPSPRQDPALAPPPPPPAAQPAASFSIGGP